MSGVWFMSQRLLSYSICFPYIISATFAARWCFIEAHAQVKINPALSILTAVIFFENVMNSIICTMRSSRIFAETRALSEQNIVFHDFQYTKFWLGMQLDSELWKLLNLIVVSYQSDLTQIQINVMYHLAFTLDCRDGAGGGGVSLNKHE